MFRITRGHSVQHVQFPLPLIRDLDALEDEEKRENAAAPDSPSPVASQADTETAEAGG
ncbi:MAG TPA: hypothetical protein VHG93_26960 [Longimicrobium sp.]|nr:hypothetical protein [Longimicrobium sp.]